MASGIVRKDHLRKLSTVLLVLILLAGTSKEVFSAAIPAISAGAEHTLVFNCNIF